MDMELFSDDFKSTKYSKKFNTTCCSHTSVEQRQFNTFSEKKEMLPFYFSQCSYEQIYPLQQYYTLLKNNCV